MGGCEKPGRAQGAASGRAKGGEARIEARCTGGRPRDQGPCSAVKVDAEALELVSCCRSVSLQVCRLTVEVPRGRDDDRRESGTRRYDDGLAGQKYISGAQAISE